MAPVNPIRERPLELHIAEMVKVGFDPKGPFAKLIQDLATRSDKTQTNLGEIQAKANVTGRTEPLSTTVGNITPTGQLNNFTNVAAGRTTDNLSDGVGSPLTGGKRGFVALDVNNRLASSTRANALNVSSTPTSATVLSNAGGGATVINIAASTAQFGTGTISYNSGSVDPGVTGTFFIFADDPTFAGGAVTYQFSATPPNQTASDGRVNFGKITTSAAASTGGGNQGGTTPGGTGGRGFVQG
jgi:hypothetical protein